MRLGWPNYVAGAIDNLESAGNFLGLTEDVLKRVVMNVVNEVRPERVLALRSGLMNQPHAPLPPSACAGYAIATNTFKG